MSLALPSLDGRLDLKTLIGEGGMGQVYRAWDRVLERAVAVKFVRGATPRDAEPLLLEARLQARIDHPNVVHVHEVGTLEGRPCIAMQLVEGPTLVKLSRDTPLTVRLELLRQAALGLHAAHRQGLVHRDVKPGNVLVETIEGGLPHALVSDFGLARDEEGGLSRSGLPVGTLDFMAPEVLLGTGPVDFRMDIYALGATAYMVLTGHLPFRRTTQPRPASVKAGLPTEPADDNQMLRRILEEDPAPMLGLPPDLRTIIAKAMEKAPNDRYPSAEAFAEDIGRFLRGEPVLARRAPLAERVLRWSRRNRTAARASLAALLILALGLGFSFWTTRQAARQSLETARLGALAESLEARVRMGSLAPAHDLSPTLALVRSEAETLRPRAARSGPAAFALGRALELLADWPGSRAAYQQAWDTGYRSPQSAEALGLALMRVYDQELRQARATLAPNALKARQAQLDRTLRDPALAYLAQGDPNGWRRHWGRAIQAVLFNDFEGARREARAVCERDPEHYEAWTLEGEIWLSEASRRCEEGHYPEAERALDQAVPLLERALAWGRSDHRPRAGLARVARQRAILLQTTGKDPSAETQAALGWIDQAKAITPDNPELLLQQALILHRQSVSAYKGSVADPVKLLEQAIQLMDRADALRPKDPRILIPLADSWAVMSTNRIIMGQSGRAALEQGLARLKEVAPLAPQDPAIPLAEVFLRSQEIAVLRAEGKDSEPAARAGLAAAERALKLETLDPVSLQSWKANAQAELGREAWRHGRDPRPDLMAAAASAEALARQAPKNTTVLQLAIGVTWTAADQLTDIDGEVDRLISQFRSLAELGLKQAPGNPVFLKSCGDARVEEAYWRSIHDQDPTEAAFDARRQYARAFGQSKRTVNPTETAALLALAEARWQLHQGRSPEHSLAEVDRLLLPLWKQPASSTAGVSQNLAIAALLRGQWAHREKHATDGQARKGLNLIARAIQLDPGDPALWVVQARLHALAGDVPAAAKSLLEATKRNPLITLGAEYKRAQAEIEALAKKRKNGP